MQRMFQDKRDDDDDTVKLHKTAMFRPDLGWLIMCGIDLTREMSKTTVVTLGDTIVTTVEYEDGGVATVEAIVRVLDGKSYLSIDNVVEIPSGK